MSLHTETHFRSSLVIRDLVIGISDGLTVPFALAAGLSGALDSNTIIVTAGMAEIAAGSIAMGLGGYLAGRTELEHYEGELKREYHEVATVPELEKDEVREILAKYGISKTAQDLFVEELSRDPHRWIQFMMRFELGLEKPEKMRAPHSALRIGFSYALGGFIPLLPYLMTREPGSGFVYSSIVTFLSLICFGYFKSRLTGQRPFEGAIKMALVGICAAAVASAIARLF